VYVPKNIPKDEHARVLISTALRENILFASLGQSEILEMINAMGPVEFPSGAEVIKQGAGGGGWAHGWRLGCWGLALGSFPPAKPLWAGGTAATHGLRLCARACLYMLHTVVRWPAGACEGCGARALGWGGGGCVTCS
jgi:hypothetical protein